MLRKMECDSACTGKIAEGCRHCIDGSKMVLFVTGLCKWNCYYCPVSLEKKDKNVIYANEGRVYSDEEIVAEAEAMDATGTGITGGDDMGRTKLRETVAALSIDVGIEVPALPGKERELNTLISYAKDAGVDFVNLNELEFSESNWDMMDAYGYSVRDELSSAVAGSRETAMAVLKANKRANVHFCSSTFKDGVQLRRRLIRRAEHTAKPYQQVTEDGTIVRGYLYANDLSAAEEEIRALGVPEDLYEVLPNKIEVAPWVLEDIASSMRYRCFLSEQYPTADGLEVERTPLN